ncbi:MAG TPA: sigma-E factor negative regulatory protein [Arenimonas sp.]|nr:sigma-E factor negative regulatory protein [Arenimonas sp.]
MNTHAPPQPDFDELLSAFMDGELPADEARFLQRRMQHDPALRERWERWQLASTCLRRQPARVDLALSERIAAAIADGAVAPRTTARHYAGWGLAAALALAIALVPRMGSEQSARDAAMAVAGPTASSAPVEGLPSIEALMAGSGERSAISPVSDFSDLPLAVSTQPKPWPRSPLLGQGPAGSSAMQARHAQDVPEPERVEPRPSR